MMAAIVADDSTDAHEMLERVKAARAVDPYTTRGWAELASMKLDPPRFVWGGIALGGTAVIFGQGGLGKSRLCLNLARNQVCGIPFAGRPTCPQPLRHLIMGTENSIQRLQGDVLKMSAGLSAEQLQALGNNIRLATLETPADPFISVSSPENLSRWRATLEDWPPDVLWVDPWGDLLAGDANQDEDTRNTLSSLRRIMRELCPSAALNILAHSRTGKGNIAQAVGWDAANFGKGSKALYSAARSVWNLAPGDEEDNTMLLGFHAKSNDGPRENPIAIRLDPQTMTYQSVPDFDFDTWRQAVNRKTGSKPFSSAPAKKPLEDLHYLVLSAVQDGPLPRGVLEDRVMALAKTGEKRTGILVTSAIHAGVICAAASREKKRGGCKYYGTPAQIAAMSGQCSHSNDAET